jgi:periplasmic divalent cation tolerance protein
MNEPEIILIMTTLDSIRDAKNLSKTLINEKLCACVQMEQIKSIFEWEGKLSEESEIRLTIKSISENYEAIESVILELHPYELPEIVSLPIQQCYRPFAEWVADQSDQNIE